MMNDSYITGDLTEFAYLPSWYNTLTYLEKLAIPECWKFRQPGSSRINAQNPILENYVFYTFRRLTDERNCIKDPAEKNHIIFIMEDYACFNTGLFTPNYTGIYAYFERNANEKSSRNWFLKGFYDANSVYLLKFNPLPRRANYFRNLKEVFFNGELEIRVNTTHILDDVQNRCRIPASIRNSKNLPILFDGAVELARKKAAANYHIALPQYFQSKMQFLLPVHMQDPSKADLALAVSRYENYYIGHTCLSLDMAYSNARLIAVPETYWLKW